MLKFKSIVREATLTRSSGDTTYFGAPRVEFNDVWINKNTIKSYRLVEKEDDKECLRINFEKDTVTEMIGKNSYVLCKKEDPEPYTILITHPTKEPVIVHKKLGAWRKETHVSGGGK